MISRLALSTMLVLGLLPVAAPQAQVADEAPDASAIPAWMLHFFGWLQSRNGPVSTSMEPREITLVSRTGSTVRLRVPEAYIRRAGGLDLIENAADGTPGGNVVIVAYLPDMLPKHLAERAGHKVHGPGIAGVYVASEDEVRIDVNPESPVAWAQQIERAKKNFTYDRDADGFAVYYKKLSYSPDGKRQRYEDVLIPLGREDAVIDCALGQSGERLGCNVSVPQEGPVRLEVQLWSTHLMQRREIVSKARSLVNSFIQAR